MAKRKQIRPVADKTDNPQIGIDRNALIRAGIDQYKKALDKKFYIEAIALMESLISDRMESTLNYLYPYMNYSYGTIVQLADSLMKANCFSEQLLSEIKDWAKLRNDAVHQMMKLMPGQQQTFQERHDNLRKSAENGYELFKKLNAEKEKLTSYQESHPLRYNLKDEYKSIGRYPEVLIIKCKVIDVAMMQNDQLFDQSSYFEDENGVLWRKQLLDMYYELENV